MRRVPGSHAANIKNRSSKQLSVFTGFRPIVRCVNNETLQRWANNSARGASAEVKRRAEKRAKKEAKV